MIDKLKVSKKATQLLEKYSKETGLLRNIIARNAFIRSLGNGDLYNNSQSVRNDGMEFNIYTLFGEYEEIYFALLRQYYKFEDISNNKYAELIRFHIEGGLLDENFIMVFNPI